MESKPSSNQSDPNPTLPRNGIPTSPQPAGDSIVIYGNVGPGTVVGRGTVNAEQIAGGDIILGATTVDKRRSFVEMLDALKEMIEQARQAGELTAKVADGVVKDLESAKELVEKDQTPPKQSLIEKLRSVAQALDRAFEELENSRSPVAILIKAVPFVALLIRLASQIF